MAVRAAASRRLAGAPAALLSRRHRAAHRFTGGDRIGVDRIRVLGGRSTHWNAVCLRFNDEDFREKSIHGQEEDWPITYEELAPFYSHVEKTIGVCGTREGLAALPDGEYYGPPPRMRCAEDAEQARLRRPGDPGRARTQGDAASARAAPGRMPCHYCSHCMQGCEVGAIFGSANTLIPMARATGRLTLRTNALVRQLELEATDASPPCTSSIARRARSTASAPASSS